MGGWAWDEGAPSADARRLFQNARQLYDRISALVNGRCLRVTPELVCELHGIATAGEPDPRKPPGQLRREDVVIGRVVVLHAPPPWQEVPALLGDACASIESKRASGSTLHAAAYALWRLNWIHPFADGNGKTARAVAYVVLCAGFDRMLPGEVSLPDRIARNKFPYWDGLIAADRAWTKGAVDVTDLETMLAELLEAILADGGPADSAR